MEQGSSQRTIASVMFSTLKRLVWAFSWLLVASACALSLWLGYEIEGDALETIARTCAILVISGGLLYIRNEEDSWFVKTVIYTLSLGISVFIIFGLTSYSHHSYVFDATNNQLVEKLSRGPMYAWPGTYRWIEARQRTSEANELNRNSAWNYPNHRVFFRFTATLSRRNAQQLVNRRLTEDDVHWDRIWAAAHVKLLERFSQRTAPRDDNGYLKWPSDDCDGEFYRRKVPRTSRHPFDDIIVEDDTIGPVRVRTSVELIPYTLLAL